MLIITANINNVVTQQQSHGITLAWLTKAITDANLELHAFRVNKLKNPGISHASASS